MCTRTSRTITAAIAVLLGVVVARGQGVTVAASAPDRVAPGQTLILTFNAQVEPAQLIEAVGGFALDFQITEGDANVESIAPPVFPVLNRGTRVGPISATSVQSIVGGQYADIDGSNPALDMQNPAPLFQITLQIAADAQVGSTVTVTAANPDPAGGVFVYPTSNDIILPVPNTPSSALTLVPFTFTIEVDCPADVNGNGLVDPGDFNAWVIAFNTQAPECDQNGDGFCTPADFNAWVLNFNTGC